MADWGYVKVDNAAAYVGTFYVTCQFQEVTLKFDWGGGFPVLQSRTTRIPGGATNIVIDFHCYVVAHATKHIATKTYADTSTWSNGMVAFKMTGTTIKPHVS